MTKPRTRLYHSNRIFEYKSLNIFGENLRDELIRLKMTQKDLSFVTGIHERTIQNWISGNSCPCLYEIFYLCEIVEDFKVENLIFGESAE